MAYKSVKIYVKLRMSEKSERFKKIEKIKSLVKL